MKENKEKFIKPNWSAFDSWDTGQKRGEDRPALYKPYPKEAEGFDLIPLTDLDYPKKDIFEGICSRKSIRKYSDQKITMHDLTYLLLATNGVLDLKKPMMRTVPSAGARHAIETYLYVSNVEELEKGLYRYIPHEHKLVNVHYNTIEPSEDERRLTFGAPLTFLWTAVAQKMSWRYGEASDKLIFLDAGHICQNLYLACEALNLGTCAVGAYDQEGLDAFIGLDGQSEYLIYAAPLGYKI
jgi:SagB-type dehydrogenase family enzyme